MSIRDLTNAYSAVHPRYLLAKKPQIRTEMVRLRTTKPDISWLGPCGTLTVPRSAAQRARGARAPGPGLSLRPVERGRPRVERSRSRFRSEKPPPPSARRSLPRASRSLPLPLWHCPHSAPASTRAPGGINSQFTVMKPTVHAILRCTCATRTIRT
jgi:hypothetical protein